MDYAAPGFYRKNGMWYQQVVGGKDMPYIVCGPGPVPDPIVIGPGGRRRMPLERKMPEHSREVSLAEILLEAREAYSKERLDDIDS